jgi:flavin-dependent dehydrogenase
VNTDFRLRTGSRIAVIGGGPAGSFFAHFASRIAREKGLDVTLTIFDGKDFLERGPRGCNLCAGVIAVSLEKQLEQEGIPLPEQRIISRLEGYSLHIQEETLRLTSRENSTGKIAAVFRGNGPRFSCFPGIVSFDDFLLSRARDREASVISEPVWGLEMPSRPFEPATLLFGDKSSPGRFEADLVVGAFGVNTRFAAGLQNMGFGYRPPRTLTTYQAEIHLGEETVKSIFQNDIHVYMPRSRRIRFATIIPKADYVTITLIGKTDATPLLAAEFFSLEEVRRILPPAKPMCSCYPRIAVSAAQRPFSQRLVLIGDAAFSRHYKNGIESAFITARLAAEAAFSRGVDAASFFSGYLKPARARIVRDNLYGRALFRFNDAISSVPFLALSHFDLAKKAGSGSASRRIRFLLWNMFTGEIPYGRIFAGLFDLRLQSALFLNTIALLFRQMKKVLARH